MDHTSFNLRNPLHLTNDLLQLLHPSRGTCDEGRRRLQGRATDRHVPPAHVRSRGALQFDQADGLNGLNALYGFVSCLPTPCAQFQSTLEFNGPLLMRLLFYLHFLLCVVARINSFFKPKGKV